MMRRASSVVLFLVLALRIFSQQSEDFGYISDPYLSFKLTPGGYIPLASSTDLFKAGGGLEAGGEYRLLPFLYATAGFSYNLLPVRSKTKEVVNLFSLGTGAALSFEVAPDLYTGAYARAGYYYGFVSGGDPSGSGNPFVQGGLYASFRLQPNLSLGIDTAYRNFLGFTSDVAVALGVSYHFYYASKDIIETSEPELRVLPVLFKYYDRNPVSTMTIRNSSDEPLINLSVHFLAREFMVNPKLCAGPLRLEPGEEVEVDLYALFTEEILKVSEGTKVSANISLDCLFQGEEYTKDIVGTLDVVSRNGLIWDDDRKAACFVTAKDPVVLRFAKTVTGLLRDKDESGFDEVLLKAMAVSAALDCYGLAYAQDPATPYAEFSNKDTVVDFLQFPNQTLEYKGGDCDDLSILYCALLESLGIETAFITVPGHIFAAFRLEGDEQSALAAFSKNRSHDLIIRDGGVWVPVEVTAISGGFLNAWQLGAQQWNLSAAGGEAGFYPVHDAWGVYEPVGFTGLQSSIVLPSQAAVLLEYEKELAMLFRQEAQPQIDELKAKISASPADLRLRNSLGVLYARYGRYDQALKVLADIQQRGEYVPAYINMGNIYYLNGNYQRARTAYEKALAKLPNHPQLIWVMARVEEKLENRDRALALVERLKELDPELAAKLGYLQAAGDSSTRSAEVEEGGVLWEE
jgi:tetratricopeptide (TPR) repeat protein